MEQGIFLLSGRGKWTSMCRLQTCFSKMQVSTEMAAFGASPRMGYLAPGRASGAKRLKMQSHLEMSSA